MKTLILLCTGINVVCAASYLMLGLITDATIQEGLRAKVESLTDERAELRRQLADAAEEMQKETDYARRKEAELLSVLDSAAQAMARAGKAEN